LRGRGVVEIDQRATSYEPFATAGWVISAFFVLVRRERPLALVSKDEAFNLIPLILRDGRGTASSG
jgi:hypothetical protein